MKSNDGKFFIINTPVLWEAGAETGSIRVTDQGISLKQTGGYAFANAFDPGTGPPVSLAFDSCGVLHLLEEAYQAAPGTGVQSGPSIMVYDSTRAVSRPILAFTFENPVSITINQTGIFVVDRPADNGLWIIYELAKTNGQVRWQQEVNQGVRIAVKDNDGLYILDTINKTVFTVALYEEWSPQEITFLDGSGSSYGFDQPVDIASDSLGNIYILEPLEKKILVFNADSELTRIIPVSFEENSLLTCLALTESDNISETGEVNIYTGFTGPTAPVGGGDVTAPVESGILQLGAYLQSDPFGTYVSAVFDSTIYDCRWHRVEFDADIPANTLIELSYLASNDGTIPTDGPEFISLPLANPRDALLIGATGQYIRFRFLLSSDETGENAPFIRSFKVWFPRDTYLGYLPGTYREDETAFDFSERFLSLFETFMFHNEEQIYHFTRYLDSVAVPGTFLSWLLSWITAAVDENWPEAAKRQLLRESPQLYRQRGTRAALSRIIEIYYGKAPIIIEHFQSGCVDHDEHKTLLNTLYGKDPHSFCVLLEPRWEDPECAKQNAIPVTRIERDTVQRIIDNEKPAYTAGSVRPLEAGFTLDTYTYLGVNSLLSKREFRLGTSSAIGRDTVLYDTETSAQAERNSRIGIEFKLT